MNRKFFAFGCSFTKYHWPTWADIIGSNFGDSYFNYGKQGAGNLYIYTTIMDSLNSGSISKDDVVIVCWTNVLREDRYIKDQWICPGNLYSQKFYSSDFLQKYVDIEGCYVRDLPLIYGAQQALIANGCNYRFISMAPLYCFNQYSVDVFKSKIMERYSNIVNSIEANFFQFVNFNWLNPRIPHIEVDRHLLPITHLEFVKKYFPDFHISESTKNSICKITTDIKKIVYTNRQDLHDKVKLLLLGENLIYKM